MSNIIRINAGSQKEPPYGISISIAKHTGTSSVMDTENTDSKSFLISGYGKSPSGYSTTTGYLQGSNDNSSWNNIYTFTQQGEGWRDTIITSAYRYFRFNATSGGADYYGLFTRLTYLRPSGG